MEGNVLFRRQIKDILGRAGCDTSRADLAKMIEEAIASFNPAEMYLANEDLLAQSGLSSTSVFYIMGYKSTPCIKCGEWMVHFWVQKNDIAKSNVFLLQLLDTLCLILRKTPPDKKMQAIRNYTKIVELLDYKELKTFINLSRKYPARVRAFLIFIFILTGRGNHERIAQTLNPSALKKSKDLFESWHKSLMNIPEREGYRKRGG